MNRKARRAHLQPPKARIKRPVKSPEMKAQISEMKRQRNHYNGKLVHESHQGILEHLRCLMPTPVMRDPKKEFEKLNAAADSRRKNILRRDRQGRVLVNGKVSFKKTKELLSNVNLEGGIRK